MNMETTDEQLVGLGKMAGEIAHEVNNPVTVILAKTRMMAEKLKIGPIPSNELADYLAKVELMARRIAKITRAVRALAKDAESDPFESVVLKTLVEDTIELCAGKLSRTQIQVQVQVDPPSLCLRCRPIQISQVLLNLLSNSVDAINALPEKWIRVEARALGESVRIAVWDSGNGVPREIWDKITKESFSTKNSSEGTGLGMGLVRKIIANHGGKIELENLEASRTRIVMSIPLT